MGTGKTSWAIQYINEAPLCQKFIYITPFLTEVERVIQSCNRRRLIQPEASKGKRKLDHFKSLVKSGEDIVSTHALFQNCPILVFISCSFSVPSGTLDKSPSISLTRFSSLPDFNKSPLIFHLIKQYVQSEIAIEQSA